MRHVTVFTANTAHPIMHKLQGYSCATKNGVEWLYCMYSLAQKFHLPYYCVEDYIFEFQVFTDVYKAVFRVSSDPSTTITQQACLAAPWRA